MTKKRKEQIKKEAKRRVDEWFKNSSFDEMSVGGSRMRFDMALGLLSGYPFEKKKWMKGKRFNGVVSASEFASFDYEEIISEAYVYAILKVAEKISKKRLK